MRTSHLLAIIPLAAAAATRRTTQAPVLSHHVDIEANKYIVKMNDAHPDSHIFIPKNLNIDTEHIFNFGDFRGFAAHLTDEQVGALKGHPYVEYIEPETTVQTVPDDKPQQPISKRDAPWNLGAFNHPSGGAGTCVYVLDSKIDFGHPDFEGRASLIGSTLLPGQPSGGGPEPIQATHGTAVAGIAAGHAHGIAKQAKIFNVEVSDAGGLTKGAAFIAGMELAVHHEHGGACPNGRIINISINTGHNAPWNDAVAAAVRAGIFVAVAAGNQSGNVANFSPSSEPLACTVGAIDGAGNRMFNQGAGVDVYAPGLDIMTASPGNQFRAASGTSMACPHVAGLAAYYMGLGDGGIPKDPQGLCGYIAAHH